MHNGYCFGLGQKFGEETVAIDDQPQGITISDYDRMRIWFDKREIGAYSSMPVIMNSHPQVSTAYERDHKNPLQITYQNERYQFNAELHNARNQASWTQIELGSINQVEMFYGKRSSTSESEFVSGFKLRNLPDGDVYTVPTSLDDEVEYDSLYRSEIGDDFSGLDSSEEPATAKVVGLVTSQTSTSSSARITNLQFIYLTENQHVCNSFSETLFVDRIFEKDAEGTEWFHWSYIVAVANFLLFIVAMSAAICCCRRFIRTRRLLSVAKRHAIGPINPDMTAKSLNTVHVLNEFDTSKQNNDYYEHTVKKMIDHNSGDIIENSNANEELRLSHSAKMSDQNNVDSENNYDDNENDRSRHVQFDDSPRIRAISIHKNQHHNVEGDEETSDKREQQMNSSSHSNRSRQSVEVLPQNSGIGNMRSSWAQSDKGSNY